MNYDQIYFAIKKEAPEYIYDLLLEVSNVQENDIVLDIGCGIGYLIKRLIPKCKNIIGVDISDYACKKVRSLYPNIEVINSSINELELNEETIDKIFIIEVIEHLKKSQCESDLNKLFRFLKPGGKLILTTPNLYTWVWFPSLLLLRRPITLYSDLTHVNLFTVKKLYYLLKKIRFKKIQFHSRELYKLYKSIPKINILNKIFHPFSRNIIVVAIK